MGCSGVRNKNDGRRKKKGPTNIISFDDDDATLSQSIKSASRPFDFSSAPATCVSSPVSAPVTSSERKSCSGVSSPVDNAVRKEHNQVTKLLKFVGLKAVDHVLHCLLFSIL